VQGVLAVEDYAAFVADLRRYAEYWRQTSMLFGLFGGVLTLAVILNTVNASLHEQQTELTILRALGVSRREITLSVGMELLIMVAIGTLIGIPLGRELGYRMISAYNNDFYGMVHHMQPVSYLIGVASMLLAALLAAIPGLRSVGKADLGAVSKSQSI
jgi:putative ABC transport system permease protein